MRSSLGPLLGPLSGFDIRVCLLGVPHRLFPSLLFCQDYISKMDPASTLGLSTDSIHGYSLSHVRRVLDAEPPEMPPCRRGVNNVSVSLKGQPLSPGVKGQEGPWENPQGFVQ